MNLSEMRVVTRYYLDDNSAVRWSNSEIDNYINQAYRNYYNKLVSKSYSGLLATPALLNIVSGTQTVALPSDFYQAQILYRVLSDRKVPCFYKDLYEATVLTNYVPTTFRPSYSFSGMNLLLDPVPSTSETGGLELHYWPTTTILVNDADEPVSGFLPQWHDLLPINAAWQAKSLREEEDVANIERMLSVRELPFNQALDAMTIARRRTEPFDTNMEDNFIY